MDRLRAPLHAGAYERRSKISRDPYLATYSDEDPQLGIRQDPEYLPSYLRQVVLRMEGDAVFPAVVRIESTVRSLPLSARATG